MHGFIITGGTSSERARKIQTLVEEAAVSPFDVTTIIPEPTSIGIDRVRNMVSRLSIRPVASPSHAIIIMEAQTMTPEAQNAFLKTLEEPHGGTIIILETVQPDALLSTILSRCHTIRIPVVSTDDEPDEMLIQCIKTIEQLQASSVGERLKLIDVIAKTREDALSFVDLAIPTLRKKLVTAQIHAKLLRSLLTARTRIMDNVTPKLALDAVFS